MKSFSARPLLFRFGACWLTILAALTSQSSVQAGDLSVTGDLGVSGVLDVNGNAFNFGSWANDPTRFGLGIAYAEDAGHTSTVTLTTTRSSSGWLWQQAAPNNGTGSVPMMRLSAGNVFTLYDQATPTPTAKIVLDPVGVSSFGTSATFLGANNLMPNQTLGTPVNLNSVLTVQLADARYLVHSSGNTLSLGVGASAGGDGSVALGNNTNAAGFVSTALGHYSSATGAGSTALGLSANAANTYATALGYATAATGYWATAAGVGAQATGSQSTAVGTNAKAQGSNSSAFGVSAEANGDYSLALGEQAYATAPQSVAIGQYMRSLKVCTRRWSVVTSPFQVSALRRLV